MTLRAGAVGEDGDEVVDLARAHPFDRCGEVARIDRAGLRGSLHEVHHAGAGEVAEDRRQGGAEAATVATRFYELMSHGRPTG